MPLETTYQLVMRAQAGDDEAMNSLFERHEDRLRRGLHKLVGTRYRATLGDSDDAMQDAVLYAFNRLRSFEYRGKGSFLAWLLCCADTEVRQRIRNASAQKRSAKGLHSLDDTKADEPPAAITDPGQRAVANELEDRIDVCLEQLPEQEREVILLRRYMELPTHEIMLELGLTSAGAVRALLSRAQSRLASLLSRSAPPGGATQEP